MEHPLIFITLYEDVVNVGNNLAELDDAGNFETDESGWEPGYIGVRSTDFAYKDNYSYKYVVPSAGGLPLDIVPQGIESSAIDGRTYIAKARVRVVGTNLPDTNTNGVFSITAFDGSSTQVTKTVSEATDQWVEISTTWVQSGSGSHASLILYFDPGGLSVIGAPIYVDAFEVYEVEDIVYHSGDRILVYWDDVTSAIKVYHEENPGATIIEITTDPELNIRLRRGYVEHVTWVDIGRPFFGEDGGASNFIGDTATIVKCDYQFCNGDDLWNFVVTPDYPAFPYAQSSITPNSVSCVVPDVVCDIHFVGTPTTVYPTSPTSLDGEIQVSAVSSHGAVRYSLTNEIYENMTNTDGHFTNLGRLSGNESNAVFLIWARDSYNCVASIFVTLKPNPIAEVSDVKYRGLFKSKSTGENHRVDIIQKDFNGAVTYVDLDEVPVQLILEGSSEVDKFPVLNPTSLIIGLVNRKNFQYYNLFSQTDRNFLVEHYIDDVLVWTGYILPSVFSEPYTAVPYITSITATDNIEELSKMQYLDDGGNRIFGSQSIIKIIAFILNKLELALNIRVACNIYDVTFASAATDDPLAQTYINQDTFLNDDGTAWDCARVLEFLLKPFLPILIQEGGYWWIIRNEERRAAFDYREFNTSGLYVGTGTYDPILNITDPTDDLRETLFAERNHTLSVIPAYGKINITHSLIARQSLIRSGNFNLDDWDSSLQFFRGWGFDISEGSGISVKQAKVITKTSNPTVNFNVKGTNGQLFEVIRSEQETSDNYALEISNIAAEKHVFLYTEYQSMEHLTNDAFNLSFEYRINMDYVGDSWGGRPHNPLWIKFRYRIEKGGYFYNVKTGWTTDLVNSYNDVFVSPEDFEKTNTIEVKGKFRNSTVLLTEQFRLYFEFQASVWYDFAGASNDDAQVALRAIPTVDLSTGYKVFGIGKFRYSVPLDPMQNTITRRYFELVNATDEDDNVNTIRPDDFNEDDNACVWKLQTNSNRLDYNGSIYNIRQIYLDSVDFDFLPNSTTAPEEEKINIVNNKDFKEVLDFDIEGGDLPTFPISNAKNIYLNYFRDVNGLPLNQWKRDGISESTTIQQILAKTLTSQYKRPSFKISGSLISLTGISWIKTLKHTQPAIDVSFQNDNFTGSITNWLQSGAKNWSYGSNSAFIAFANDSVNSNILYQTVSINSGQRVRIEFKITADSVSGTGGIFGDDFLIVGMVGDDIVQQELLTTIIHDDIRIASLDFTLMQDINRLGFMIKNQNASNRTVNYNVDFMILSGVEIIRYYILNSLGIDVRKQVSSATLVELSQEILSSGAIGADFSGAYSNAYGGSFNTILN